MDLEELKKLSPSERQKLLDTFRKERTTEAVMSIINGVSEKCSAKCITSPGTSLSGGEKQCLQKCVDRWQESLQIVAGAFSARMQQAMSQAGGGGLAFGSMDGGSTFT